MRKMISILLISALTFCTFSCAKSADEQSAQAGEVIVDTETESVKQSDSIQTSPSDDMQTPVTNENQAQKQDAPIQNEQQDDISDSAEPTEKPGSSQTSDISDNNGADGTENGDAVSDYDPYALEPQFDTYVSNTFVPTGNHYALVSDTETTKTFRSVFPVQQTGRLEYCFYFSNCVDSTWGSGDVAYRNMPTESYEILAASVMITKTVDCTSTGRKTTVTFDKKKTRTVEPDEMFWSDPVMFNVTDGEYLVFEWKVKYTFIPCNKVNGVGYGYQSDNGTVFTKAADGVPMPSMIGAKRDGTKNIAFIGDSITAGEGAGAFNGYVAQISNQLGSGYSVWNLGLGYARANDAVNSPAWLKKAKSADNVAICFGVNDINSGVYSLGTRTADEIISDIATIAKEVAEAGGSVTIISTPTYDYADSARVQKWQEVVKGLKALAKTNGYGYFDFGACVSDASDPTKPAYGGHPNGEGCKVVADTFINEFKAGTITFK